MISVIVIAQNEERNLPRCLTSVRWADEIVVVDAFSTDRTADIAREHGARVLVHEYDTDLRQRDRAFKASSGDWLFVLDADEEVSPELAAEIRAAVAPGATGAADGYAVARLMQFGGRWIRHGGWYPGYTMRLFRRDSVVVEDAAVHGGYAVRGPSARLRHDLYHYSYDSLSHYLRKMNDYTTLQVTNLLRSRPGYVPGPGKLLGSPVSHFLRNYISRKGYRDGVQGFLLAVLDAIYALALYAKVWERHAVSGVRDPAPVTMDDIRALRRRAG